MLIHLHGSDSDLEVLHTETWSRVKNITTCFDGDENVYIFKSDWKTVHRQL